MRDLNRREFIRTMGTALGGAMLAGCEIGGDSGGQAITTPNGYRFYALKRRGDPVGDAWRSTTVQRFGGSVHISANGRITFDAYDGHNRHGLFQLDVDLDRSSPVLGQEHALLLPGDVLADHRIVGDFAAHDVDAYGRVAAVIHPDYAASRAQAGTHGAHYGGGLYFHYDRAVGFAPVMGLDHPVEGDDSTCNGVFGDVALCENNGLLAVASHTARAPGGRSAKSLLHLSSPWDSRPVARPLMTTGDYLRGSDHQLSGIGIIDVSPAGHFGMSTHFVPPRALLQAGAQPNEARDIHHGLLAGHLAAPADHFLLAAPPELMLSTHAANVSYGPRVGFDGTVHSKVGGLDGGHELLVRGDRVIRRTDEPGPGGERVHSFTPGAVGADGAFYYTQYADGPDDRVDVSLWVHDGVEHRVLLASGDVISKVGGEVANIVFSTTTNHVDTEQRIVMLCEFTDGDAAIVVGVPA